MNLTTENTVRGLTKFLIEKLKSHKIDLITRDGTNNLSWDYKQIENFADEYLSNEGFYVRKPEEPDFVTQHHKSVKDTEELERLIRCSKNITTDKSFEEMIDRITPTVAEMTSEKKKAMLYERPVLVYVKPSQIIRTRVYDRIPISERDNKEHTFEVFIEEILNYLDANAQR